MKLLVSGLSDAQVERLRQEVPTVKVLVARTHDEALALVPEADALFGMIRPDVIRAGRRLRWVQAGSAGVEGLLFPELRDSDILLTNARGIYGPQLADHTMAFILALARRLPVLLRHQRAERWEHRAGASSVELDGQTLLIVGLGGTGRELARRAVGFGMRVVATRRHPDGPPPGVEAVHPPGALHTLLPQADWVALCCPLTSETRHLIGAEEFRRMKSSACLTNVTRGGVVDHDALVAALRSGEIAGAGLDVTEPEPLPPGHPLWQMDNVILTPHTSGQSQWGGPRLFALLCENARRFAAGQPLRNVVDKQAGY